MSEDASFLYAKTCTRCGKTLEKPETGITPICESCYAMVCAFWERFNKREFDDIDDYSDSGLAKRHKNVVNLQGKFSPMSLGNLIIGEYYGGSVWGSRGMSHKVARLFKDIDGYVERNGTKYMMFYCDSSAYVDMMMSEHNQKLLKAFVEADKKDRKNWSR